MTMSVGWQFLIKQRKAEESLARNPKFDPSEQSIEPLEYKTARNFIIQYEWLGNMGTSKYCFGLFLSKHLACVVCYGPLVAPSHYSKILGSDCSGSILQLCRGASTFWAPKWAPSRLISSTLRRLNRELGFRAVVAYADPEAGEVGTIYQACNAYYLGETSPGGGKRYIIKGHSYDPRKVHKKFGSRSREHLLTVDPDFHTRPIKPKHRYLFILGSQSNKKLIVGKIEHLIRDYPKRAGRASETLKTHLSVIQ